jgi:two-component system phosphate regulon sensor histidine kinase PhoR
MPLNQGRVGVFLENRQEALLLAHQRDRWTSDVAHELKTPLTSIRLVGETLKPRVDPSLTTWVERLLNEVYRLSNLVDDVLNLSQLEQLTEPCPIDESTDIVQLLRQAWQSLEPLAQQKKLRFQYEGPAQLGVEVNPSLMHRVFVNLFDNAIKYSPAGQMIQAKLSLTTGDLAGFSADVRHLLIEVIDAGPGFAAKDLPYIFDRFYRADPARSREQPQAGALASSSTGLGLSIVQKIVASHQGLTQAQNHPETHGGWLRIWLPGKRVKDLVQSGPA